MTSANSSAPTITITQLQFQDGIAWAEGYIRNHPILGNNGGRKVQTSKIKSIDFENKQLVTRNTTYVIVEESKNGSE